MFFQLFDAIFALVFENVFFNPLKIVQGTFLGPFLHKKVVFGKVTYGPCDVFIFIFTSVQIA
jgi:hypothetical protein